MKNQLELEADAEVELEVLQVEQPIGTFYLAKVPYNILYDITHFDVRRMLKDRDVERYLGIQRPLSERRVVEIKQFVGTKDACFPTNVILSVPARCASFTHGKLILRNDPKPEGERNPIFYRQIAKVLDGQHRIAGLADYRGDSFDIPVCIFVDIDTADEAFIFSTVNLAQTKVNRSLVYDLYDLAKARSPQKTAHIVTVTLDRTKGSPLFQRVKRLGSATLGRDHETLTQATVVESMLPHFSGNPVIDRDLYLRGAKPVMSSPGEASRHVLRSFFLAERDREITDIFWNYFKSIQETWPDSWSSTATGRILCRTNGIRALLRFFGPAYRRVGGQDSVPEIATFRKLFGKMSLPDGEFSVEKYKPGSSGESLLYSELMAQGLEGQTG